MKTRLRKLVWNRADGCCEYCRLDQDFDMLPHHVDHVIAQKHDGPTVEENLALACVNCSLAKGPNIAGRDPRTGKLTRLFHPRTDPWVKHFRWNGPMVIGRTAVGRTTASVLKMNHPDRVTLREMLIKQGIFPPLSMKN
jgi:hypothetical protein